MCYAGRYTGFLVQVLQIHGDTVQVRTTECWEVLRSVLRRVPTEFGAENEPVRFMAGTEDPFLHTPGSHGALHVGERVVLEGATFPGAPGAFCMVYGTILSIGDDGFVRVRIGERWNVRNNMLTPAPEITDPGHLHPRTTREAPWGVQNPNAGPAAKVAAYLPGAEPAGLPEAAGAQTRAWGSYLVFTPESGDSWIRACPTVADPAPSNRLEAEASEPTRPIVPTPVWVAQIADGRRLMRRAWHGWHEWMRRARARALGLPLDSWMAARSVAMQARAARHNMEAAWWKWQAFVAEADDARRVESFRDYQARRVLGTVWAVWLRLSRGELRTSPERWDQYWRQSARRSAARAWSAWATMVGWCPVTHHSRSTQRAVQRAAAELATQTNGRRRQAEPSASEPRAPALPPLPPLAMPRQLDPVTVHSVKPLSRPESPPAEPMEKYGSGCASASLASTPKEGLDAEGLLEPSDAELAASRVHETQCHRDMLERWSEAYDGDAAARRELSDAGLGAPGVSEAQRHQDLLAWWSATHDLQGDGAVFRGHSQASTSRSASKAAPVEQPGPIETELAAGSAELAAKEGSAPALLARCYPGRLEVRVDEGTVEPGFFPAGAVVAEVLAEQGARSGPDILVRFADLPGATSDEAAKYRERAQQGLVEQYARVDPAQAEAAGAGLVASQASLAPEARWAANRQAALGPAEATALARVTVAAQRAIRALATEFVAQAKAAPVDSTVCLDSGTSKTLIPPDTALELGLEWDTSQQDKFGGAAETGGFTTFGHLLGKFPLELETVSHGYTPWALDAEVAPVGQALASTPCLVKAMNLIVVDCLNQDGARGSFAIDPEGRVIPLHAAQNKLTVLPVRGQTPWTRSKPDSIESFAAELLRRIKSGRELSAKLAAAHGATPTSEEAALAARELAQAAGHQAQMAAQDADGEYAPCSLAPACECEDGCSSDEEDSEPLPAKLAQQMLERDEHVLCQLAPGLWGPAAKAAGLVQSVGSQTEDLGAPGRILAKRHGHVVLSTRATHELAHASVDRTLQSLRIGGARVASSDGTVHQGDKITAADVSWQRKCPHCAQYKTVNRSVGRGHSVRGVAGEALARGAQAEAKVQDAAKSA